MIGRFGNPDGPRVIVVTAIHGNEPAGVHAVRGVLDRLERDDMRLRGEIIALIGNMAALRERTRYTSVDLNRLWTVERVAALRDVDTEPCEPAAGEQWHLLRALDALIRDAPGEVLVVDLHSTSGPGSPFVCISDTLRSRAIALALPVPLILGIEEAIHGTLLEHLEEEGRASILVEGGQHDAVSTEKNLESALWLILEALGALDSQMLPDLQHHRDRLRNAARHLPRVVEVIHRHPVEEGDHFRMRDGFAHFDRVRRGQPLADDDSGTIPSPTGGLLVMPRYQIQGADGFFIGRAVRRSWLSVSSLARGVGLDRLLPTLPGVSRDARQPHRVTIDPHVARWFTVQLFHLSGFRRLPDRDGRIVFTRRIEPDSDAE